MFFCQWSTSFLGFSVPRLTCFEASAPSRHTRPGEDKLRDSLRNSRGENRSGLHFRHPSQAPRSPATFNLVCSWGEGSELLIC